MQPSISVRVLVSLVCVCILLAFVHVASSIVIPCLLALTLSVAFQPVAEQITRLGWPSILKAILVTLAVLAMVGGASFVVYLAGDDLASSLPKYGARLQELQGDLAGWLTDHGMRDSALSVQTFEVATPLESLLAASLLGAGGYLQTLFLVIIITAFIQIEAGVYRRKLVALGGHQPVRGVMAGLHEVQRYMVVKVAMSLANGVFLGLWCWMWGVDSPLLWGVLAFALNFIPIIGSILAAIPPILLGLLEGGIGTGLGVMAGYVAVNVVVDNIIEPRITGRAVGLSPLVVLLSLMIWGFVLGPVGALLSVPLTMSAKIMFEHDDDLRQVAMIMSNSSDLAPPPSGSKSPPKKKKAA